MSTAEPVSEHVEKVARAICIVSGLDPDFDYDPLHISGTKDKRWRLFIPQATAALAALAAPVAAPVQVKALEWSNYNIDMHKAETFFGYYVVAASGQAWLNSGPICAPFEIIGKSVEAAKAAEQADYEQRIRSALVYSPSRDDVARDAAAAGWNACRKSIYAVCEDVINENEKHRSDTENEPRHHFGRGGMSAAKSIARGFNSMEAEDDDNFTDALRAISGDTSNG